MIQPPRVALFSRYPEPGRAKTRLIPALGPEGAANLHRRLTERTLQALCASGLAHELRHTGAPEPAFRAWLGQALPMVEQGEGDLGARMARAAEATPVILLGADLPDLSPRHLQAAAGALRDHAAVIGPAEDGGYYLLGLREPMPFLFEPMEWGTATVFSTTMARFAAHGVTPALLEPLADLDRPEDLARWPGLLA
ncbi:TIGR04282 family arsenosugar biosynthesis glycosyltransferase [Roseomonas sp. SSH11]|uniref:TIGR04282 family arsenosugar biosynthesis glycosyltransferase n=1 Tax=Pararoseomonas baculiformis TaxID=2820812 RepID=A0ABS4AC49_9PROT|nr:TIGR04282 family arsenosugar biosynthesis glycosyltransferase [Pararoseomonas baculiformis]